MQLSNVKIMKRATFDNEPCSIARSLDVLGDWWNPLILRECLYGVHRFQDIQRWLNIGRNILTSRLQQLVGEGLLEKREYQHNPPRFEYHLTDKGYDATLILLAIMPFGEKWYFAENKEPIVLIDRDTRRRVRPAIVDEETGEVIDPRKLIAAPGESFPHGEISQARFREYFSHDGEMSPS